MWRALPIMLVTAMSGCICGGGASAKWGLSVDVLATDTGQPIAGATVIVYEGDYVETLQEVGIGSYYGAAERPGVYRIEIESPDYAPAVQTGVEVDDGRCDHVDTTHVEITLSPL